MEKTKTGGESGKIEQSTASKAGDAPTLNVHAMLLHEHRPGSPTSGDDGKGGKGIVGKNEAEGQKTDVVEGGESQGDSPSDANERIKMIREKLKWLGRKEEHVKLSVNEKAAMVKMRLEEQDYVFEQYFDALRNSEPDSSPAIQATYDYVFKRIDKSKIKMQIETGEKGKTPIEHIEALPYSREYATCREDLRTAMTGQFFRFGFTDLGDVEDGSGEFFMKNVRRGYVERFVDRYLNDRLDKEEE